MENQTLKYLLIEHLPILQDGFKHGITMLSESNPNINLIGKEIDSSEAYSNYLAPFIQDMPVDLVWMNIDFPLPIHEDNTPYTLLAILKKHNPQLRIAISLQQTTVYSLRLIFQKINPHVIVELIDCDQKTINTALDAIIHKEIYYSKTVLLLLHRFLKTFESMDSADYNIIRELDKGTAVTALPKKVLLSHSTILSRRTNLKILFNLEGKTDSDLLREVKRLGYI